ncbi:MAG: tRNA pseudouridine synthase B [Phycisphaerales bacterium]
MGVRNRRPDLNGLLVIDKPYGWTSAKAVAFARRATGGAKVGHAGTLDPLATGVLILCIGKATRMVESLMNSDKGYDATVDLSRTSESHDLERDTRVIEGVTAPNRDEIDAALHKFVGQIMQTPPAHSAVMIGGKRAYELARRGKLSDGPSPEAGNSEGDEAVGLSPKLVQIHALEVLSYQWPVLMLRIECGRGTYIRSLARDLGAALKTGGVLTALVRTRSGGYTVEQARRADVFEKPITMEEIIPIPAPPSA